MKNTKKIAINKHFFASALLITLIFLAFGINVDDSYALDLNESCDDEEMGLDIEDKLENSQNEAMEVESQSDEVLRVGPYVLDGGTFGDIQNAVDNAEPGSRIVLNGYFYPRTTADEITVNKELTFVSTSSATLDAMNKCRIISLNSASSGSSIHNIKFINGFGDYGGAVLIKSDNVVIDNCTFDKNHVTKGGGAIKAPSDYLIGINTVIKNCKFTNNYAKEAAGAVSLPGNNSKIINCSFISNRAINNEGIAFGGAISIGSDVPNCIGYVRNCSFVNNSATSKGHSHGGAGCIRHGIQYIDCEFINNVADEGGALTYHGSGAIRNCVFIGNCAKEFGGALSTGFLYNNTMDLNIKNCVFNENEAPLGGAVQLVGTNIKIEKSSFNDNHAFKNGGAANMEALSVVLTECSLNGNIAEVDGGAVFINGENTLISHSSFMNNSAIPDYDKYDEGLGGAVYVNSTNATIQSNTFFFNTARNGSAVYYDKSGKNLILKNNTLYQNQAWVYQLPIFADNIYYEDSEKITVIIHGGNNIAKYGDLAVSNAVYNAADCSSIEIDGESPIGGATDSGVLYQDDREYNIEILLTVERDDGTVVYNGSMNSTYLGEISQEFHNLQPGKYYVTARHYEDTYYKGITNRTMFVVSPKVDNKVLKTTKSKSVNFEDIVVWTLNITNNGPNNATGVVVTDVLPEGLVWFDDDSNGTYDPETGILYIGDLEIGKSVVVNIITIVNKTGELVNKVNVTSNEFDYNLTNNHDEENISVLPACDLEVIKSVNSSNPKFSDLITWTIVVKNNGPDVASEVILEDIIPKGLIWVDDTGKGKYDHYTGNWTIGALNPNDSIQLQIITRVNATGLIQNNASVTSKEFDYDLSNNKDNESVYVEKTADVLIIKMINNTKPNYGDTVKWTLIAKNNGPDNATDIYIRDSMPEGLMVLNSTASKGVYDNGVWAFCCLKNGEVATLEILCKVIKTGNFTNFASINASEVDPNLTNNQDNESIQVPLTVDIEVIKGVNDKNPSFGEIITWLISVKNNGPDDATNVVLYDVLDDGLIFKSYMSSTGEYLNNKWIIGNLASSHVEYLNISCEVSKLGIISNEAYANSSEFDINMSNNKDSEFVSSVPIVDLSIIKLVNNSNLNYGDLVKWTLIVSNNGPNNATNVIVKDTLPKGLDLVKSSEMLLGECFSIDKLQANQTKKIELICKVASTGTFKNVASVKCDEPDSNPDNNHAESTINVNPACDLSITKTVSRYHYTVGDIIRYTVKVANNGPNSARNVLVSEIFDENLLDLKSVKATKGSYSRSNHVWSIPSLDNGKFAVLYIKALALCAGTVKNMVSVVSDTFDFNKSNNAYKVVVDVDKIDKIIKKPAKKEYESKIMKSFTKNKELIKVSKALSKKESTGNPLAILLSSMVFSMMFFAANISKKR